VVSATVVLPDPMSAPPDLEPEPEAIVEGVSRQESEIINVNFVTSPVQFSRAVITLDLL